MQHRETAPVAPDRVPPNPVSDIADGAIDAGPRVWRSRLSLPPRWPLLVGVIVVGGLLRTWGWPDVPRGLNQDEVSAGYEAWSLLTTGKDRWGSPWPAYFASWGTGQNVLYSYLSIPFIALGGMTAAALRAVQLLAGLLTLVLVYPVAERARSGAGFWATLVVAVSPWHLMLSRWALESNLLPFTLVLGLFTLGVAFRRGGIAIPFALLPFSLALYAYGISVVPVAIFLVLVLIAQRRAVLHQPWYWASATAIFLVTAVPFALVLVKTYIVHARLPFESLLPFSLPDQSGDRLAQVSEGFPLLANIAFAANGFNDGQIWNSLPDWSPVSAVLAALALFETLTALFLAVRARSVSQLTLVDCLAIASVSMFFVIPFNVNQGNVVALAVLLSAGKAMSRIRDVTASIWRPLVYGVAAVMLLGSGVLAFVSYMGEKYAQLAAAPEGNFEPGFEDAIKRATALSPNDPVSVSPNPYGGYMRTLWYLKIPAQEFQASSATFTSPNFGRYVFTAVDTAAVKRFSFVVTEQDPPPCSEPRQTLTARGVTSGVCNLR